MTVGVAKPVLEPWCVCMTSLNGVTRPTAFSLAELDRAREAALRQLADLGIRSGDPVLLISRESEGGYLLPLEDALREREATLLVADDVETDAKRVVALIARFHPTAVLGLGCSTLAGLAGLRVSLPELLGRTCVVARPDAHQDLVSQGLNPLRWLALGPALGLEGCTRDGVAFAGEWWFTNTAAGDLLISSTLPRVTPLQGEATGLRGVRVVRGESDVRLFFANNPE